MISFHDSHMSRARSTRVVLHGALSFAVLLGACNGDSGTAVGPSTETPASTISNPLAGATFWVDPASQAQQTADAWRSSRPADAVELDKVAQQPVTPWFGDWNTDIRTDVDRAMTTSISAGTLPVFVAYNIPQRDCGGHSSNNSTSPDGYRAWIAAFADGIGTRRAAVILEPDALGGLDCLSANDQQIRLDLIHYAVETLAAKGGVAVYIDAGNSHWHTSYEIASRLRGAGVASAQGFALNVSNFLTTAENIGYGRDVSALVGGKHFVIDTGRNGAGANGEWCNPPGRALGPRPTAATGTDLVDAYLWIKAPGVSDGACNGAVASGQWLPEYALGLAQRAAY